MDLHGQVEFLGERDVGAERLALQFLGGFAGAEQVHAGFADGDDLVGVGGGEAVYFGHGFVEGDVVPGLVFDGQAVGAGCRGGRAARLRWGYGDCGVHGSGMLAGHVDGGHEVGQLATAVDYAFDTDVLSLFQQFVDAVDGYFALAFFHGFVTHGLGEGHDGCDVGVVVDDVRVFGQRLGPGAQLRLRWCLLMFSRLVPIGPALRANSRSRVQTRVRPFRGIHVT